jgi:hypothetical protein
MLLLGMLSVPLAGCAGGSAALDWLGTSFRMGPRDASDTGGPTTSGVTTGSTLGGTGRTSSDPCGETQDRKFVHISMRNTSQDYIHYFFVMVAYVYGDRYPDGAVCPDDVDTYIANGYTTIVEDGEAIGFGNECIIGPALVYFHESGRFQSGGSTGLASAIGPADESSATYDSTFTASGRRIPVPNWIWFHNPGTGEGRALHQAQTASTPCDVGVIETVDSNCEQDAFYYVDEYDNPVGSQAGTLSPYVRFPSEIQGTGCTCFGTDEAYAELAPSGATGASIRCNEFGRGGRIEFVFLNDSTEPPPPQLVWRVRDSSGAVVHDFDDRANVD